MTDAELFIYWMKGRRFTNKRAAEMLDINISTVKRLKNGSLKLTRERKLAMAAIASFLPPFSNPDQ